MKKDRLLAVFFLSLLNAVLPVELINAAAGVDQLLLAGVEGVALGADLNRDVLLGGAGLYDGAAGASDGGLLIIGMDSFLHWYNSSSYAVLIVPKSNRWHSYKTQGVFYHSPFIIASAFRSILSGKSGYALSPQDFH